MLVSAIISCRNAGETLAGAVQSVLDQDFPQAEILIVDGASTDDSASRAEALAARFSQVRLLRQPIGQGPAAVRNTGLRQASGRYVCFLDAEDEYAPGFFAKVVPRLERDPELAAVFTGVELLDCCREVHPLQLQAIIRAVPCNFMVRKAAAELMGGFPEGPAVRGRANQEAVFKQALASWFKIVRCGEPYLRLRVRPGSPFDSFLERSRVVGNKLTLSSEEAEGDSGELAAARTRYGNEMAQRLTALAAMTGRAAAFPPLANRLMHEVAVYDALRTRLEPIPGFLHPQEGFALYQWAKGGLGQGAVVEIGSLMGRSTGWLASATRDAERGKVVAVDHFRGSPEHQPGAPFSVAAIAQSGSTLAVFQANLQRLGLGQWVEVRVGGSREIGAAWQGPIRLLFIDGDHAYEASRQDVQTWSRHVIAGGVMAFHDIGAWPGVTQYYKEWLAASPGWQEIAQVRSLRLVQRKA